MNHHQTPPDTTGELLRLLTDHHRRSVLSYFQSAPDDVASVQKLAREIGQQGHRSDRQVAIVLHHSALPKLADTGVIDYDTRTRTVRYHGHSELEALLECSENW